jgi:hypothetical protein
MKAFQGILVALIRGKRLSTVRWLEAAHRRPWMTMDTANCVIVGHRQVRNWFIRGCQRLRRQYRCLISLSSGGRNCQAIGLLNIIVFGEGSVMGRL